MAKGRHPRKPSGQTGPIQFGFNDGEATLEWRKVAFPKIKSEVEQLVLRLFEKAAIADRNLFVTRVEQNPDENGMDGIVHFNGGSSASLELTELLPLDFRGQYDQFPSQISVKDMAELIFQSLRVKAGKYPPGNNWLLVYSTHWSITPSPSCFDYARTHILRDKTLRSGFERIFVATFFDVENLSLDQLYPCDARYFSLDTHSIANNKVLTLSPEKWFITRGTADKI